MSVSTTTASTTAPTSEVPASSAAAETNTSSHTQGHVDAPGEGAAVGIPPSMKEIKLSDNVTTGAGSDSQGMSGDVGSDGYPEQAHAGQLGLGPNYRKHPTTGDKVSGTMEEIKGKILRNPEKAQHGHDMKTGELFEKEKAKDDAEDPFAKPEGGDKAQPISEDTKHNAATNSTKQDA
ncbi:hypothetical protein OIV83_001165 [Microbotryomycetes sp. JL201]|nr:hypothetical protein OIV83_001165 [Microbotryomycetes sp. JL201]